MPVFHSSGYLWKVPFNITTDLGSTTQERRSDFFLSLGKETGHASSYLFREPLTLKKHILDTIPFCCGFEGMISQRGKPVMHTVMLLNREVYLIHGKVLLSQLSQ